MSSFRNLCMCPSGTIRDVARNGRSTCSACGMDDAYGNVTRLRAAAAVAAPPKATATVTVTHITLVEGTNGVDVIYLHTTLPHALGIYGSGTVPMHPTLKFDCQSRHSIQYCVDNFPDVPVNRISVFDRLPC